MQILTPPQRNVVAGAKALPAGLLSGRPNGGKRPREACARREWDNSDHFGLETLVGPAPACGPGGVPPFQLLENPGHSWLFVPLQLVVDLGIAGRISGFSYIVGSMAALEEDCDAAVFADALEARTGRGLQAGEDVARVYDGLFDWDNAYDAIRGARRPAGEEHYLGPYFEAAARRIAASAASSPSA